MPGAARIGALHVMLGLDSADFTLGLAKAQAGLGKFAKVAGVGFTAVAAAAVAAGTALTFAIKGAIDNADHMDELAQAAGVSVEALTSLGYAAKFSGIDADTLANGLRKLSQNMLAVAQGSTGPVAAAFTALGISVQNANGTLRGSDQVLTDVAEKFSQMENGAQKTALAVQLFGKSGAQLIPFLNEGRDGIAALTTEADRLGITLSSGTAAAAGQFNDTLDRLRATFDGVINKIMQAALPALNQFGQTLASPEFAANAQAIGVAIVGAMQLAVDAINTTVGAFNGLRSAMEWARTHDMFGRENGAGPAGGFQKFNTEDEAKKQLADALNARNTSGSQGDFYTGIFGSSAAEITISSQTVAAAFVPVIENATAAGAATSALSAAMSQGKAVFDATRTPAEAYGLEVERLNGLLKQGAIDQDTYSRAVIAAQDAMKSADSSGSQLASSLSDGLASVFGNIIDGSKSAAQAINDLTKSLINMALQQGFKALIGGLFGGGGFLSGLIPGFATGTNSAPGGLAMVGERGPELVNLPRGSQVIPNSALGGGQMQVAITLDNALLRAIVTDEAGRVVGQAAPTIVGAATQQAGKNAPGAMARYQQQEAGSDYRL